MVISPEVLRHLPMAFWIGFLGAGISAWPIFRALVQFKSRQTISQYAPEGHQAKQGTPTMGGLIVAAGVIVWLVFWLPHANTKDTAAYLGLFLGFAIIGFVDDYVVPRLLAGKRGLGWKQKILMQIGMSILVALSLKMDFGVSCVVIFLILFFSNAYNFSDGLDGLAGTLGLLLFGAVGVLGLLLGAPAALSLTSFAICGAYLPFLFLNAPPAKIFMGDVGSLPLGAVLGLFVAQLAMADAPGAGPWSFGVIGALVVLSIVMICELVPVPLQILSVKVRKKKLFPYTPIHHAFEKAGWPESRVVWRFAFVQAVCSAAAVAWIVMARPTDEPKNLEGKLHIPTHLPKTLAAKVVTVDE